MIRTYTARGRVYVTLNNRRAAIMERSPFTGEWCYGAWLPDWQHYAPPFKSTRRRTIKAAAKVAVAGQ
jgi:hypothetical protein